MENWPKNFLLLCQVIAMIKGLYGLMIRLEPQFSEAIRHSIHSEVQEFIQVSLREPLRKAVKSKKATLLKTWVKLSLFLLLHRSRNFLYRFVTIHELKVVYENEQSLNNRFCWMYTWRILWIVVWNYYYFVVFFLKNNVVVTRSFNHMITWPQVEALFLL